MINDLTSLFILNHTEEQLHLDLSIKSKSQSYQSRCGWKESQSFCSATAPLGPNGSQYTAKPAREMLRLHFWLIMHFFPLRSLSLFLFKLFIEDRFIIPICQASEVFN